MISASFRGVEMVALVSNHLLSEVVPALRHWEPQSWPRRGNPSSSAALSHWWAPTLRRQSPWAAM